MLLASDRSDIHDSGCKQHRHANPTGPLSTKAEKSQCDCNLQDPRTLETFPKATSIRTSTIRSTSPSISRVGRPSEFPSRKQEQAVL